jgi:hypothetical protein
MLLSDLQKLDIGTSILTLLLLLQTTIVVHMKDFKVDAYEKSGGDVVHVRNGKPDDAKVVLDKWLKLANDEIEVVPLGLIIFWAARNTVLFSSYELHVGAFTIYTFCRIIITSIASCDASRGYETCQKRNHSCKCWVDSPIKVLAVLATIFLMIDMLNGVAGSFAIFQWTKDYLPGSVVVNGTDVYLS